MSAQECIHYNHLIKEESLVENNILKGDKLDKLVESALKTLEDVMN